MSTQSPDASQLALQLDLATDDLKRWMASDPNVGCERVFESYPALWDHRDSALELIYLEYVLRQDRNDDEDLNRTADDYARRFPRYRDDILHLLQVDEAFGSLGAISSHGSQRSRTPDMGQDPFPKRSRETSDAIGSIGDYQLLDVLGQGGMGIVYRAVQQSLGRIVAVKTIHESSALDRTMVARLQKEAELASGLQHPNIVQIYEVGSCDGTPFISMEYVSGGNLAQSVRERPLKADVAAKLVAALARAIDYAHQQQVIHRDLKPANILLSPSQRPEGLEIPGLHGKGRRCEPKIVDFGLAMELDSTSEPARSSQGVGTPSYMSPEQIDSSLGSPGATTDVYALGAILYHTLGGRPPFMGATSRETLRQVLEEEPIALRELQPRIPIDLETICKKCLRKAPTTRYASAAELADDLQRFLDGVPIQAKQTSPIERTIKWSRRHPSLCGLLVAMMGAFVLLTWLWRHSEQSLHAEREANQRSEQLIYARNIALAKTEYRANNAERSKELLERCSESYRHWEWDYLSKLVNEPIWRSPIFPGSITCADLSPDSRLIAVGMGRWGDDTEQFVHVWDRQTNTEVAKLLGHPNGSVMTVRFSPNGKRLLTASTVWGDSSVPGKVIEWDLDQGQPTSIVIERSAKTAAYSPNGQSIYVGCVDGSILVVDATTGEIQREWDGNGSLILSLNVSQDGRYLASSSRDGVLCVWDLVQGQRKLKLQGLGDCRQVVWNRDGTRLSVCDYGGLIRHFGFDQGQLTLKDTEMRSKSPHLCYAPDGMTLASSVFSEGADIRIAETDRVLQKFHSHHGHVLALAFDASGRWFLTGGADGTVCVWDVADRTPYYRERIGTVGGIATAVFRPGHAQFAIGIERLRSRGAAASGKPRLELYNSQTLQLARTFLGHTDWVTCMTFDSSGDYLVSGSADRTIRVWDVESGSQTHCLKGHDSSLLGAWIQEPGESVVSVDDRGAIHRWHLSTQESIWSYQNVEESVDVHSFVTKAAYSARTDRLALAIPSRGRIDVWDMNQLHRLGSLPLAHPVHSMEFHPDGIQLAVASERSAIELWNTSIVSSDHGNAQPVATMTGHSDTVTSIAFSADGERLVSVSKDETIRLFETHRGFELMVLDELRGQNSIVAFSPDSKQILRCEGRRMSLWSTERFRTIPSSYQDQLLAWHRDGYLQANSLDDRFALEFHLTRLMELEPETASHWYHRGRVRSMHNDYEDADTDLRKALSMRDNLSVRSLLCRNYLAKGDLESYRKECLSMIDQLGDSKSDADVNLVAWTSSLSPDLRMELERFVQPMEEICNRTQRGDYWNTLSLLYYRMERMDDAIRAANESIRINRAGNEPVDWMFRAMSMARLIQSGDPRAPELRKTLDRDLHQIEEWKRLQTQSLLTGSRKEARILRIQNVELKQFSNELEQLLVDLR